MANSLLLKPWVLSIKNLIATTLKEAQHPPNFNSQTDPTKRVQN